MAPAGRRWILAPADDDRVARLAAELGWPPPVARALALRGPRDATEAERFINPRLSDLSDPFRLPAMDRAVARLRAALDRGERIVVYGDYDVDGITSTALLLRVLRDLGADAAPFLPHRMDEGYGLSPDALRRCVEEHRPSLLVTVDCGTSSVPAAAEARRAGLDVIVTDHHAPGEALADCVALVNPKLDPAAADLHVLAGVGVAFKLGHALVKHGRQNACTRSAAADLRRHLDLVALGTITDIVPLTGENRILARHGLARLNQSECLGLRTLAETAGITRDIDVYEVSFLLGPRLNAAGRLGDALKALELLLTAEPDTARRIARELDSTNRERQRIEKEMFLQATRELDRAFDPARDFGLVLARDDWHPGVIGIVASKLVQRYGRPVVCIALDGDAGRGSSRSIEGFDLVRHLGECADLLVKHGGHAMAAGLEIETPRLDTFRHRFNELARRTLAGQDLRPVQRVDAWIDLGLVDDDLLRLIDGLRPFGHSCPAPVWAARGVRLAQPPRLVGQNTLKLVLASGGVEREAVAFGMGDRPVPDGPLDVAFQARRDHFNGQDRLSLVVQDFRPSATEENG